MKENDVIENLNVFVNGLNSRTGGGKKILANFLTELKHHSTDTNYYVLTPSKSEYIKGLIYLSSI